MVLDAATGDYYTFDSETDRWAAEGNVGIQKAAAESGGVAAAVWADAAGALDGYRGAKKVCVCCDPGDLRPANIYIYIYYTIHHVAVFSTRVPIKSHLAESWSVATAGQCGVV